MAGHSHFSPANVEEHFEFTSEGRKRVILAFVAGVVALAIGIFLLSKGEGHEVAHAAAGHAAEHGAEHAETLSGGAASHHEGAYDWTNRILGKCLVERCVFYRNINCWNVLCINTIFSESRMVISG